MSRVLTGEPMMVIVLLVGSPHDEKALVTGRVDVRGDDVRWKMQTWKVGHNGWHPGVIYVDDGSPHPDSVASVYGIPLNKTVDWAKLDPASVNGLANAYRMAACNELEAACEEALKWSDDMCRTLDCKNGLRPTLVAALKKARGEA